MVIVAKAQALAVDAELIRKLELAVKEYERSSMIYSRRLRSRKADFAGKKRA
jgi:hypothetical protein